MGIIFAKKTKAQIRENYPHTKISTFTVNTERAQILSILTVTPNSCRQVCLYTQTKVKQHHIFFEDTVFEVAERNMWVMEIKYFEFYCKFYYFYEHLELQMILSTKYFDNLRPFTKQVKNDKENQGKKFEADV